MMNFMKIHQSMKMAIASIMSNKARSALTMLGMVIGVSSVILLTSLGGGMTKMLTDSFADMGTKNISLMFTRRMTSRSVEVDDLEAFVEENPDLFSYMSPQMNGQATVKVGNSNFVTTISAYDSCYADIMPSSAKLQSGRYLSSSDIENRAYVAVVGTYIQKELFGGSECVGEKLKMNGKTFTVIGVFEEKDDSTEESEDNAVTIPYTTAIRFLKTKRINSFMFDAVSEDVVEEAVESLETYMEKKFGSSDGFNVSSVKEILEEFNKLSIGLNAFLGGIAGISLIVGGIGIMNIMTVSVSERTREIGIRKAIGARTTDILLQFLIESVFLSAIGGILGIGLGYGLSELVTMVISFTELEDMQCVMQPSMVAVSFGFSVFVGVFFGLAPAKKAAKLNPIDALHSE